MVNTSAAASTRMGIFQGLAIRATFASDNGPITAGGQDPVAMRRQLEAEVPMGRIGSVEDIAGIVALLVSPRGRYITGTAIQVDGGLLRGVR